MKSYKSLKGLAQKYRGKPKKFADGGSVRRPAAAPTVRPFDPDYIERLAAQAIGSGEPVTELRSAEGRGFAPTPRSFGEAGQRMSAVIRGDVEPTPEEERQMNVVRGFTEGPASIRAYHGSPYAFERFDISKIGTGEGNQAYGRGLYFADKEAVARTYFDDMVGRKIIGGSKPDFNNPEHWAASLLDMNEGSRAAAIKDAKIHYGMTSPELISETVRLLRSKKSLPPMESSPGHMYEVRLRTAPEEMVNWNAPLVQQPERAIPFLEDVLRAPRTGSARVLEREMKPIGEAVDLRGPEVAAQLREAGIPGLRYLDAGSRSGGRGTRNYVMFGDDLIDITRRYAEGGLAALDQKYAEGGTVRAPKEMTIRGQEHELAYITPSEAELLKYFGGSGRMTKYGVRAYYDGPGGEGPGGEGPGGQGPGGDPSDNAGSMSDPGTQDAAGGNAGQGAGPTGAGSGPTGETGPGPTGQDTGGGETSVTAPQAEAPTAVGPVGPVGQMSMQDPEGTQVAANMQTAVDAGRAGRGVGIADTGGSVPSGFSAAPGIGEAIGALGRGEIGLTDAIGYGLQSAFSPPGVTVGVSVDELGAQTPAVSIDPIGLGLGALGMISGIPGLGMVGGLVGSAISNALGVGPSVVGLGPNNVDPPGPTADTSGGFDYIDQPAGTGTLDPALASLNQQYSEQLAPAYKAWDWSQIQRDAAANNMTLDAYVARNMGNLFANAPRVMKEGGAVTKGKSLEELHRRYAEGGDVRAPAGEVAEYDPEEIDRIARQIHLRFPEDDMPRTTYDEVESPTDLITRARLLMRGQNVGMPRRVGMGDGNDVMSSSTGLMELPLEDDRYGVTQRMLNTSINAMLDPDRNAGIGLGLSALERPGERGFTGYGPQVSASYGPASVYGGYQSITPNFPGAKSQGSYTYGGNLRIPLDEEGAAANIGANIMAGRRGQMGMGSAGTQITGSLERPFLGGRLGLDVSVDPSLRQREILLGYRRAF